MNLIELRLVVVQRNLISLYQLTLSLFKGHIKNISLAKIRKSKVVDRFKTFFHIIYLRVNDYKQFEGQIRF